MVLTKSSVLVFFVNGKKVRLCGTKLACGEGGCGACTVMVSKYDRINNKLIHLPVNACLAPICSMHGLAVTTVEGIGSTRTRLHPVQERIAKTHGSQCGFCTPGIVMSMYVLLRNSPKPTMKDMEVAFQGNLCRCTGYRAIIEGYKTFTKNYDLEQHNNIDGERKGCAMGDKCCKLRNGMVKDLEEALFKTNEFAPYDPSQEPIFPPELKLSDQYDREYLVIKGETMTWFRPTNLEELLELKNKFPEAKIVVGNSEVGIEIKFQHKIYPHIVQPVLIPEMVAITSTENCVRIGASVTLMDVQRYLSDEIDSQPEEKTRIFKSVVNMLNWFAGKQIRSVGCLAGSIMTGSPISDMIPILMANEVTLELLIKDCGKREVLLDQNFFTGYRNTVVKPEEILLAIHIPYTNQDRYSFAYKQARRREDDIAIVNIAINVSFEPKTYIISDINVAFGGMSFKTVTAPKTRSKLKGLPWNRNTLEIAFAHLQEDLPLDPGAPGGMYLYRRSLTLSLFFKGFLTICADLQNYIPHVEIGERELSGIGGFDSQEYKSSQYFSMISQPQKKSDLVHVPVVHVSAFKQATGEAVYCDDIPFFENELYLAFVVSTKAHAKILSVDASEALAMEGVHYFVSAKDIEEGRNHIGTIVHDEKVFYDDIVTSQGQVIGGVVAVDQSTAQKAARKVKIVYKELEPVILTIPDAIKHNSFFFDHHIVLRKGDIEQAFKEAPHILEGETMISGQEHFYFETQCAIAVPKKEDGEMEIYAASQYPAEIADTLGEVLGIDQNKITVKVKRLGGGFGGKETKATNMAVAVGVAAYRIGRPVRCMLDRNEDIVMTGGRHPSYTKYKVAFDSNGKILGAFVKIYNNCGYSHDLSPAILARMVTHYENSYYFPAIRVEGYLCKTNLPSNTAFRGFGGPQGMYAVESMLEDVANYLKKNVIELRELNLFKEGDINTSNQKLDNCNIRKCWQQCMNSSNYYQKRKEVDRFNKNNRYKKRGLSLIPTKFGISFPTKRFNQGGALILVYTDGSVLLHHGGIELGQGLYTKMLQVASKTLEIPLEKIHTSETSTGTIPNTSATAASSGSDLNGMAIIQACNTINERLKPFKEANPKGTWEEWVKQAYLERVSLSAAGFYQTPGIGFDWKTGEGTMFSYFTYGVGCCEVEIDTLTGDHEVRSVDIVMDVGESLNPALDIGQIEGGFMQGYGLFTMEELVYSPNGTTLTKGPGTYKIPGFADIPREFNVSLLKDASNPGVVYSSKGIGEPPFFLGSSAFFAIKDAIKAARVENGFDPIGFTIQPPATSARIRMACQDHITAKFKEPEPGTFKPWSIVV